MSRKLCMVTLWVAAGLLIVAAPIYAFQQDRPERPGRADPKELAKLLTDNKMTLSAAIAAAEKETKGTAIRAFAMKGDKPEDGPRIEVQCVTGDTVQFASVDKAGKVTLRAAPDRGERPPREGEKPKAPEKPTEPKK